MGWTWCFCRDQGKLILNQTRSQCREARIGVMWCHLAVGRLIQTCVTALNPVLSFIQKPPIVFPSGLWTIRAPWWRERSTSCSARFKMLLRFSIWPWGGTKGRVKFITTPSLTSRPPRLSKCPPSSSSRRPEPRTERSTGVWQSWSSDQRDHSHLLLWPPSLSMPLCTVSNEAFPQF